MNVRAICCGPKYLTTGAEWFALIAPFYLHISPPGALRKSSEFP